MAFLPWDRLMMQKCFDILINYTKTTSNHLELVLQVPPVPVGSLQLKIEKNPNSKSGSQSSHSTD